MDEDHLLQRHLESWQQRSGLVQKLVLFSLIFGFLLQLNIISAYPDMRGEAELASAQVSQLRQQIAEIDSERVAALQLAKELSVQRERVEASPWTARKQRLIAELRRVHASASTGTDAAQQQRPPDPLPDGLSPQEHAQNRADAALDDMAHEVRQFVIKPLQGLMSEETARYPELGQALRDLETHTQQWVAQRKGKRDWWRTVQRKDQSVHALDDGLAAALARARSEMLAVEADLRGREAKAKAAMAKKNQQIAEVRERLTKFQSALDDMLPSWIRGLITAEQMVALFPGMLVLIVAYVFALSASLSEHFECWADRAAISEADRRSPATSTLWTLTHRGRLHTFLSYGCYLGFFIGMALLYDAAVHEFHTTHALVGGNNRLWAIYGERGSYTEALFVSVGYLVVALAFLATSLRLIREYHKTRRSGPPGSGHAAPPAGQGTDSAGTSGSAIDASPSNVSTNAPASALSSR